MRYGNMHSLAEYTVMSLQQGWKSKPGSKVEIGNKIPREW